MDLVHQLETDHRNFARILKFMESQIDKIEKEEQVNLAVISEAMHYVIDYQDVVHHPKEDVLFDLLRDRDESKNEVIDKLESEHKQLALDGLQLQGLLEAVVQDEPVARESIINLGRKYIANIFDHMRLEETEILPSAADRLNKSDWQKIEHATDWKGDPVFGDDVEDDYQQLRDSIMELVKDS